MIMFAQRTPPVASTLLAIGAGLVLGACAKQPEPVKTAPQPKAPEPVKNMALLETPKDGDVFASELDPAAYPALKISTVKPGPAPEEGEPEEVLEMGETAHFHLVGRLASGKEFKNTRTSGGPQMVRMMEWGYLKGVILGTLGMKLGETRRISMPPELAFGENGSQTDQVHANAHVSFLVTLDKVEPRDDKFLVHRVKEGDGATIAFGQEGRFKYTGILCEGDRKGEQFDTSEKPGGNPFPMTVGVGGAILGWVQGGLGMRVGEKRWLKIPPPLAYGAAGRQPNIPGDATLIFEMELVSISKPLNY